MGTSPPPRLYGLVAAAAPVAVVFRRGPSRWCHVLRWDLASGDLEPGAWLFGRIYVRRCDLSPDGELLLAFVMKITEAGFLKEQATPWPDTYVTVSRAPWLHALAAWRWGSTWGGAHRFDDVPQPQQQISLGEPDAGDIQPLRGRYGIVGYPARTFEAERYRGWVDAGLDGPEVVGVRKDRPGRTPGALTQWLVRDEARPPSVEGDTPHYAVTDRAGAERELDVAWADWAPNGHLLVATWDGALEVRDPDGAVLLRHDLRDDEPSPAPAPDWATTWRTRRGRVPRPRDRPPRTLR